MLFSLENSKNRQTLGALQPDLLASGGCGLCAQTPTPLILHCEFFSLHLTPQSTTLSESAKRPYFLLIIARCAPGFRQKILCCILYATDYGNYNL